MATDAGDYAEGTAVVASILHFEVGTSAVLKMVGGFEDGRGQQFGVGEDVGDEEAGLGLWASGLGGKIRDWNESVDLSG